MSIIVYGQVARPLTRMADDDLQRLVLVPWWSGQPAWLSFTGSFLMRMPTMALRSALSVTFIEESQETRPK